MKMNSKIVKILLPLMSAVSAFVVAFENINKEERINSMDQRIKNLEEQIETE